MGPSAFKLLRVLSGKFRKLCNSFDGDTLVSTEFGLRPIRDIKIGDKVWAYNEETGEKSLQKVVHLIQTEGTKELVDIQVMGGEVITATAEHPFYLVNTNEWAFAKNLTLESLLQNIDGEWIGIEGVAQYEETHKVYNLTVNNDHTYFVGEGQVLTHNASVCKVLTGVDKKHILRGEINARGKAKGWHHRPNGDNPAWRRIIGRPSAPDANGVYRAKVMIKNPKNGEWVVKDARSTFFPDRWSEQQVLKNINAAYLKALMNGKVTKGGRFSERVGGVKIEGFIDDSGRVTTAYPLYKE